MQDRNGHTIKAGDVVLEEAAAADNRTVYRKWKVLGISEGRLSLALETNKYRTADDGSEFVLYHRPDRGSSRPVSLCPKCGRERLAGSSYCRECKREYEADYRRKRREN